MKEKTSLPLRRIRAENITKAVKKLFIDANTRLGRDVVSALRAGLKKEQSPLGRQVLEKIIENATVASKAAMPLCQDTGLAVLFIELGQDVRVTGGDLSGAVEEGVRQAYHDGCLRKSLCDPLTRMNTGDNTPAIIHTDIVPGNQIKIIALPKGGGSENMSRAVMLTPAAGMDGIRDFILETVEQAGANPCPPVIVGVGIGGSLEAACLLAKKALLRPVGRKNKKDRRLAELEGKLLADINALGIGPAGMGGRVTALAVHAEMMPCHIASLPVAVNLQCHAARHAEVVL
ncbi:MAG TPA: fumarate hydratase [Smithellaceae bacterium]|nr:fumarate hydratase [Smithellaceae bacterium]HQF84741.1 fumarate hydratase [Smithellaceae bacterium]HQG80755.1 fumarate hydratase [Smithellaceae bacterium]